MEHKKKKTVERECLRCGKKFKSEGVWNRCCGYCRGQSFSSAIHTFTRNKSGRVNPFDPSD